MLSAPDALKEGVWQHLAAVADQKGFRFYLNGTMVGESPWNAPLYTIDRKVVGSNTPGNPTKFITSGEHNYLGRSNWRDKGDADLAGELDEVRVWKVARTTEQIRDDLAKQLTGNEPGLVGLWNFDDAANPGRDASPSHHDGKLIGNALASIAAASPVVPSKVTPGAPPFGGPSNRVLNLDGDGNFVELPPNIFNDLSEITVEGWVKWDRFQHFSRFFEFGSKGLAFLVAQTNESPDLKFYVWLDRTAYVALPVRNAVKEGQWRHIAAVADQKGFRLYLDGVIAAESSWAAPLYADGGKDIIGQNIPASPVKPIASGEHNYLGRSNWREDAKPGKNVDFDGQMDEIRVWKVARTTEEIRENILKQLTGSEPGLVGLWNFDDAANPGRDASPNHHDGKLGGNARAVDPTIAIAAEQRAGPFGGTDNRVLILDGIEESYVQLPPDILRGLNEVTVEGWVRWDEFLEHSRFFFFGEGDYRLSVLNHGTSNVLYSALDLGKDDSTGDFRSDVRIRAIRADGRRMDSHRRGDRPEGDAAVSERQSLRSPFGRRPLAVKGKQRKPTWRRYARQNRQCATTSRGDR
jgi:hypothetical protein